MSATKMFRLVAATLAGSKSTVQEPAFMNVRVDDLKALPLEQRIKLVEDLWDSIAADLEKQPVSEDVKSEMRRRRDEYVKDPSTAVDWEKTRDRLGKRK